MRRIAFSLLVGATLASACAGDGAPGGEATGGAGDDTGGSTGSGGKPARGGSGGGSTSSGGASGSVGSGGSSSSSGGATGSGGSSSSSGGSTGSGGTTADSGSAATGGTAGAGPSDGPAADAGPSAPSDDGGAPAGGLFPVPEGMTRIFDGKTLTGWSGNPAIWTVDPELGIHGKTSGPGGQLIKTTATYDDFRLVLTEKAIATTNHMGICFWGSAGGYGYGGCIDVIPPSGSLWDYGPGGGQLPGGVGGANNPIKFMWHQVEILATASTGEILVAVNGKQTTMYKKAGRGKKGPIGLQAHAGASDQAYKDIWVEVAPKEHRLLTVK
jgi:hypothetical protein